MMEPMFVARSLLKDGKCDRVILSQADDILPSVKLTYSNTNCKILVEKVKNDYVVYIDDKPTLIFEEFIVYNNVTHL